jgi:membrane protein DedA with SNARE-associated domain
MGKVRFAVANGLGALLWAALFTAVGFYAAEWWRSTSGLVHIVMAVAALAAASSWLMLRRRRRGSEGDTMEETQSLT